MAPARMSCGLLEAPTLETIKSTNPEGRKLNELPEAQGIFLDDAVHMNYSH
jgi:hypothetical protein